MRTSSLRKDPPPSRQENKENKGLPDEIQSILEKEPNPFPSKIPSKNSEHEHHDFEPHTPLPLRPMQEMINVLIPSGESVVPMCECCVVPSRPMMAPSLVQPASPFVPACWSSSFTMLRRFWPLFMRVDGRRRGGPIGLALRPLRDAGAAELVNDAELAGGADYGPQVYAIKRQDP
ncbi:hypothetical protein MMC07_002285 [Pseudocyphellaria aurata]|nr:hypothetical protein [Pseudocyphellaria aurata]